MLAGFNFFHGLGEFLWQRHRYQNQSMLAHRSASQDEFGVLPGEMDGALRRKRPVRKFRLQQRPGGGRAETGFGIAIVEGDHKSSLQCRFMSAEFGHCRGEIASSKGALCVNRGGNRIGLGCGILRGVIRNQRSQSRSVLPYLFHRL